MAKFFKQIRILLIPFFTAMLAAISLYYGTRSYVIKESKDELQSLLLSHRGFHQYIQLIMHPTFYKARDQKLISKQFYNPAMLSSSFMVRVLHEYYNKEREKQGFKPIYYKMAAHNPRNPVNQADEMENRLIDMFNQDRGLKEYKKIIEQDNKRYLYYAMPFLENEKKCMVCHGKRKDAPQGLQTLYKGEGGFNEKEHSIRAIESIKIPIDDRLHTAFIMAGSLTVGIIVLLVLLLFNKKLRERVVLRTDHLQKEIKEKEQAQQKLIESRQQLSLLIEKMPSGCIVWDSDFKVTLWNPKATEIFGYNSTEAMGKNGHDLIIIKSTKEKMGQVWQSIFHETGTVHNINENITKDGKIICCEWFNTVIRSQGKITGVLSMVQDVSQRMENERILKNSLEEKEILLKEIHHRVKNNLAIVSSFLDLQSMTIRDKLAQQAFIESVQRIKTMAMVHERLYRGSDFKEVDIKGYFEELSADLISSFGYSEKNLQLRLEVENVPISFNGLIPMWLIVNEIVSNALKHAYEKTDKPQLIIRLEKREDDQTVILAISDNGIGMPDVQNIMVRKTLGMMIISALVGQLSGKMKIDNIRGTKFTITFPVEALA